MGTVHQNMSQTTDNPGATALLSTLLPSVILLASSTGAGKNKRGYPIIRVRDNTEMNPEKFDSWKKSSEEILHSVGYKLKLLTTSATTTAQSSENEDEKKAEAHPSFLASSILICFLLFPSLLENKKYEARIDYHESCHLQTSAMSKVFPSTKQTFEVTIVFEKNQLITEIFSRFDFKNERKKK